jgi:hypothetical protein
MSNGNGGETTQGNVIPFRQPNPIRKPKAAPKSIRKGRLKLKNFLPQGNMDGQARAAARREALAKEYREAFLKVWALSAKICMVGEIDLGKEDLREWGEAVPKKAFGKVVLPTGWDTKGSTASMPIEKLVKILIRIRDNACVGLECNAMDTLIKRIRGCPKEVGAKTKERTLKGAIRVFNDGAEALKIIIKKENAHKKLDSIMGTYQDMVVRIFEYNEAIKAIEDALGEEAKVRILNDDGETVARTLTRSQIMETFRKKMLGEVTEGENGYLLSLPGTEDMMGKEGKAKEAFRAASTAYMLLARMGMEMRRECEEKFVGGEDGEET